MQVDALYEKLVDARARHRALFKKIYSKGQSEADRVAVRDVNNELTPLIAEAMEIIKKSGLYPAKWTTVYIDPDGSDYIEFDPRGMCMDRTVEFLSDSPKAINPAELGDFYRAKIAQFKESRIHNAEH